MAMHGAETDDGGLVRLLSPQDGAGPLLQRDYWAAIRRCGCSPAELMELVARRFEAFAPRELVVFRRSGAQGEPLEVGQELAVHITDTGTFRVRVLHRDAQSLTLGTLEGHPEAGRITFGAYRNERGDVLFHIRSRARASSPLRYLGFRFAGEPMQTNTWTDFVNSVAWTVGEGVIGLVHAETCTLPEEEDEEALLGPTYLARGDRAS